MSLAERWASVARAVHVVWRRLRSERLTPVGTGVSVAVGLGVGLLPVYGLHGAIVLAVCLPLRLDSVVAFAATMVSNPLTFPFIVWLELKLGEVLVGTSPVAVELLLDGQGWSDALVQLVVGTAVLSSSVAATGFLLVWVALRWWQARSR